MSPIYMAILWPYIEDKPISGASGSQAQADAIQARAALAAAEAEVEAGRRAQKKPKTWKGLRSGDEIMGNWGFEPSTINHSLLTINY